MTTSPYQLPDMHQMLSEQQAADTLCQSVRTLQKWRVTGFGPAYFKIGRSVRYRRQELLDWIESRRRAHTSQFPTDDDNGPQCA